MIDKVYVFDDIIEKDSIKKIQDIIFNEIRWQFIPDVTKPDNKQQRPGFNYKFISINPG